MSNFIEKCIAGDALSFEIDDYIDVWHSSDSELELHEYLGMTLLEYSLFVENESYLGYIISAHKSNVNVNAIIRDQMKMAARSDEPIKARNLQNWLENEGLWD